MKVCRQVVVTQLSSMIFPGALVSTNTHDHKSPRHTLSITYWLSILCNSSKINTICQTNHTPTFPLWNKNDDRIVYKLGNYKNGFPASRQYVEIKVPIISKWFWPLLEKRCFFDFPGFFRGTIFRLLEAFYSFTFLEHLTYQRKFYYGFVFSYRIYI